MTVCDHLWSLCAGVFKLKYCLSGEHESTVIVSWTWFFKRYVPLIMFSIRTFELERSNGLRRIVGKRSRSRFKSERITVLQNAQKCNRTLKYGHKISHKKRYPSWRVPSFLKAVTAWSRNKNSTLTEIINSESFSRGLPDVLRIQRFCEYRKFYSNFAIASDLSTSLTVSWQFMTLKR